jgi:hypothetical protein
MKVLPEAVFFSLISSGLALFRTWMRPSTRRLIRVCMNALEHCITIERCAQQARQEQQEKHAFGSRTNLRLLLRQVTLYSHAAYDEQKQFWKGMLKQRCPSNL